MKNLKYILAAVLFMALAACGPAKDRFVIEGTVNDPSGLISDARVLVKVGDQTDTVDVLNGNFHYEGTANPSDVSYLSLDYPGKMSRDRSFFATFVAEGGKTMKAVLADSSYVCGSPLTDTANELNTTLEEIFLSYQDRIMSAYQDGDEQACKTLQEERSAELKEVCAEAFKANSANAVGYIALATMIDELSVEELEDAKAAVDPSSKSYKLTEQFLAAKKALSATSEGGKFVDFEGKKLDGTPVKLSDYVGKGDYVLIDFWASWCGPCKAAMPELRETYLKYSKKGLKVVGIDVWERNAENGPKCVKDMDMIWDIILSVDNTPTEYYGVNGIPTAIIFDPDGTIVKRGHPMDIKPSEFFAEIYK